MHGITDRNGGDCERTSLGRKAGDIHFRQMCMVIKHLHGALFCWKHGVKCRQGLGALHIHLGFACRKMELKSRKCIN